MLDVLLGAVGLPEPRPQHAGVDHLLVLAHAEGVEPLALDLPAPGEADRAQLLRDPLDVVDRVHGRALERAAVEALDVADVGLLDLVPQLEARLRDVRQPLRVAHLAHALAPPLGDLAAARRPHSAARAASGRSWTGSSAGSTSMSCTRTRLGTRSS